MNNKMKIVILIALFVFAAADLNDYYIVDNNGLDIGALIAAPLNIKPYVDCFLDEGPCNNVGASYKKNIAEAIAQSCRRCSPEQKKLFWQFILIVKAVFPAEYDKFWNKYDPEHKYFDSLMTELDK